MKTLLILLSLIGAALLCAEELPKFDVLNVGPKVYKTVKVTAIEPSGIRFSHADGAGRAKFEELDPAVRSQFKFDPDEAKKFEEDRTMKLQAAARATTAAKETQAKNSAAAAALKNLDWQMVTVKIWKAVPGGYLCHFHTRGGAPGAFARAGNLISGRATELVPAETHYEKVIFVSGIKEAVAIDQVLDGMAAKVGVQKVNGQPVEHWMSKP